LQLFLFLLLHGQPSRRLAVLLIVLFVHCVVSTLNVRIIYSMLIAGGTQDWLPEGVVPTT